jgi:hypothetical protein
MSLIDNGISVSASALLEYIGIAGCFASSGDCRHPQHKS